MIDENVVDATPADVVDSQVETVETPEVQETTESVTSEVANPKVEEKPVQSPEENSKFAEVRRKAQKEAEDKVYADLYSEYGINSKADYEAYIAKQKETELMNSLKDEDVDPTEIYKALKENDPEYKELQQIKQERYITTQISELNAELEAAGLDTRIKSVEDVDTLPNGDKMVAYIQKGYSLSDAYFLSNKNDIIAKKTENIQSETIRKIQANGQATPGSLSNSGETQQLFTRAQVDAMSQDEVNSNYDIIMKSMKTWK